MKKLTVTVGIPIHNEEENIVNLLDSVTRQAETNFKLQEVLVICDGTTDRGPEKVRNFMKKEKRVTIQKDGLRKGKMNRLMEIYRAAKSEIVIIFDGDTVLASADSISGAVAKFADPEIIISGMNNQPVQAESFLMKLINRWSRIWYFARAGYRNGDNINNARGCGMAVRSAFAKKIKFPENINSDAQYVYLLNKKNGGRFAFNKESVVLFRKPSSYHDYMLQTRRSEPDDAILGKLFAQDVKSEYRIPAGYKIGAILKSFFEDPLMTVLSAVFSAGAAVLPYFEIKSKVKGIWERPASTKRAIAVPF